MCCGDFVLYYGASSDEFLLPPSLPPPEQSFLFHPHEFLAGNALVCGGNLPVLRSLPDECVDLTSLDPRFNSNQFSVAAFGDEGMVRALAKYGDSRLGRPLNN